MRRIILLIGMVFCGLAISFGVGEITIRVIFPNQRTAYKVLYQEPSIVKKNDFLWPTMIPNTMEIQRHPRGEFEVTFETNSLGFRDYEFTREKPEDLFRILVLGDSFTVGWGVELEETYSKILEKKLMNENKIKYQVINGGWIGGHSTDTLYLYLKKGAGLELKPDFVIIGFFPNDITDLIQYKWKRDKRGLPVSITSLGPDSNLMKIISCKDRWLDKLRLPFGDFFCRHSYLYNFIAERIQFQIWKHHKRIFEKERIDYLSTYPASIFAVNQEPFHKTIQEKWEDEKLLLREIKNILDRKSIKMLLVIIPGDFQVDTKKGKMVIKYFQNEPLFQRSTYKRARIQEMMVEFCAQNDIPCLDLLPIFEKHREEKIYFDYDPHWTPLGHEICAQVIFDWFKKRDKQP